MDRKKCDWEEEQVRKQEERLDRKEDRWGRKEKARKKEGHLDRKKCDWEEEQVRKQEERLDRKEERWGRKEERLDRSHLAGVVVLLVAGVVEWGMPQRVGTLEEVVVVVGADRLVVKFVWEVVVGESSFHRNLREAADFVAGMEAVELVG